MLLSVNYYHGPNAFVHFEAHLDTWDTYFGAPYTHGNPLRRATEEKLFLDHPSIHEGIRGTLYSRNDLKNDGELGLKVVHWDQIQTGGIDHTVKRFRDRVFNNHVYLSIDIDVLDHSNAPGKVTSEIGVFIKGVAGNIKRND